MKLKLPERRRFVRIEVPIEITVFRGEHEEKLTAKNISPMGFMLRIGRELEENTLLSFRLKVGSDVPPVGIKGKVIWQNRVSLEDGSPFEAGIDICDINDADKNGFLRCICDLLYGSEYKERT